MTNNTRNNTPLQEDPTEIQKHQIRPQKISTTTTYPQHTAAPQNNKHSS
ncbi:1941_t:CDS:1, partial [Acaulospora morrowiae]